MKIKILAVLLVSMLTMATFADDAQWLRIGGSSDLTIDVMKNSGQSATTADGSVIYVATFRNVTEKETQLYQAFLNTADCTSGHGVLGFANMDSKPIAKAKFVIAGDTAYDAIAKMLCIVYSATTSGQ